MVISFDALRADGLGLYGSLRPTSPNLDAFGARCLVFDRAYSAAPVTVTSFAAALSGELPFDVYADWKFEPRHATLGEVMRRAGFRTAAVFNNAQLTPERGFGRGFDDYVFHASVSDQRVVDSTAAWLGEHDEEPFFLWTHFIKPHGPYTPKRMSRHLVDQDYDGEYAAGTPRVFDTDDPAVARHIRQLYDGEIFYADTMFGRLLDVLRERGRLNDTLILITADHGEEFKEHGAYQHVHLYEETLRVPLLMYHPHLSRPRHVERLYSNVDLLPTLAAWVGVDPPPGLDGRDVLGPGEEPGAVVGVAMTDLAYRGFSMTRGDGKLILDLHPRVRRSMHLLDVDPGEQVDRRGSHGELTDALTEELWGAIGATGARGVFRLRSANASGPPPGRADAVIEELRALGYLSDD